MFENQIKEFDENISALRIFVSEIKPFLENKQKESFEEFSPLLIAGLKNAILKKKEGKELEEFKEQSKKIDEVLIEKFGENVEVEIENIDKKEKGDNTSLSLSGFKISSGSKKVNQIVENLDKYPNQIALLYRNSFISLLSSVEWFFSQILHKYYSNFPKAAGINKKTLTLDELKGFGSIQDAENYLIESKIEEILRSSFDDWVDVLDKEIKLGLGYLKPLRDKIIEIYQRRNIIIHNGGKVNSIYLSKVSDVLSKGVEKGDVLKIDEQYLEEAICTLHSTFILIACELWKSLEPDKETRGDALIEIIYDNLVLENWNVSESLSYFLTKDSKMGPIERTIGQLNYWLCRKRKGEWDKIKNEVEAADYSDKKDFLQIGLYGLREQKDDFFELLPKLLETKALSPEKVIEFPIFKEMREADEFKNLLENSEHFKELQPLTRNIANGGNPSDLNLALPHQVL